MASLRASPRRFDKVLSDTYFSFISFGVPFNPSVYAGDTTGSANSHILPTGSLKAPSPYINTSNFLPVSSNILF